MLRFGKKSKLEVQCLSNLAPLRRLSRKRAWMGGRGERRGGVESIPLLLLLLPLLLILRLKRLCCSHS